MKVYFEGEKSKAICPECKDIVETTFRYESLKFDNEVIPNILQSFCDVCGSVCSFPHQEVEKIKSYLKKHRRKIKLLEYSSEVIENDNIQRSSSDK